MKPVHRRIASRPPRAAYYAAPLLPLCLSTPARATGLANSASALGAEITQLPWFLQSALPAGTGIGFLPICLIMFLSAICLRQFIH